MKTKTCDNSITSVLRMLYVVNWVKYRNITLSVRFSLFICEFEHENALVGQHPPRVLLCILSEINTPSLLYRTIPLAQHIRQSVPAVPRTVKIITHYL